MTETEMRSGSDEEFKTSGDYAVYDAPNVGGNQPIKGFAFLMSAAEQAGRFVSVTLSEGDDLEWEKTTSATARYSTDGPAVRHIYISHDVLENFGGESTEEGFDAPESLGISVAPSTEEAYEEAAQVDEADEAEAEALLSGVGDDDSVEVEEDDSDEVDAEALLAEADEAAE